MYCSAGASLHHFSSRYSLTTYALNLLVPIIGCLLFDSCCYTGTSEVFTAAVGAMSPYGYGIGPTGLSPSTDASFSSQASPNGPTPVPNWCGPLTGTTRQDKNSTHSYDIYLRSTNRAMTILFFLFFCLNTFTCYFLYVI
jgi:hypothetical protein